MSITLAAFRSLRETCHVGAIQCSSNLTQSSARQLLHSLLCVSEAILLLQLVRWTAEQ